MSAKSLIQFYFVFKGARNQTLRYAQGDRANDCHSEQNEESHLGYLLQSSQGPPSYILTIVGPIKTNLPSGLVGLLLGLLQVLPKGSNAQYPSTRCNYLLLLEGGTGIGAQTTGSLLQPPPTH